MTATLRVDEAGRLALPKEMRDRLRLAPGSVLKAEIVGDKIELSEETPQTRIVYKKGLRVIAGWEGFDAAKAVLEAREREIERLDGPPQND